MRYVFVVLCVALAACGEVEDTKPGRPVAHRQKAFSAILRAFEPMGIQLRENRFEPISFMDQARLLDSIKDAPWEYFGEDTQYPPSKSLDRLWEDRAGFDALTEDFLRSTSELKTAAESRDLATIRTAWSAVEKTCRDCHKAYRR